MNSKVKDRLIKVVLIILIPIFAFFCWRVERYFNWKFGYGPKVDRKIQALENRIIKLEGEHGD